MKDTNNNVCIRFGRAAVRPDKTLMKIMKLRHKKTQTYIRNNGSTKLGSVYLHKNNGIRRL